MLLSIRTLELYLHKTLIHKKENYMDLIDAINAIDKTHEDDVLHRLTTVWGDSLDKENV